MCDLSFKIKTIKWLVFNVEFISIEQIVCENSNLIP